MKYTPPSDNLRFRGLYRIPSARWPGYDYSQAGAYFITICTKERVPYFGAIATDSETNEAYLTGTGCAARAIACWQEIPAHFPFVVADAFVVMPDHIHGILLFERPGDFEGQRAGLFGPQSNNLASVVRGFKVGVSSWATRQGVVFGWQSRYYDRIIRNEDEMRRIQHYIHDNPARWAAEQQNPVGLFR
jgi:putative transposase